METTARPSHTSASPQRFRLWPGVIAGTVVVFGRLILPAAFPGVEFYGLLAGIAGALAIVVWWTFFSRARWSERLGAVVLMIGAAALTPLIVHPSIAGGLMGRMVYVYAVPATIGPAFVLWAVATRRVSRPALRWATMAVAVLTGCGVWALVRTEGVKGEAIAQLAWRWTPTAEERLLARGEDEPVPAAPAVTAGPEEVATAPEPKQPAAVPPTTNRAPAPEDVDPPPAALPAPKLTGHWPAFRGPRRDGVVPDVKIDTNWSARPPVQLWRKQVGPGWSSFAVDRELIYTQEQRGEHETVSCYLLSTGDLVWRHRDPVRFYESNGGAGPRGTPTVHEGRVYTMGATGIVNALDARTGAVAWSRNAQNDTGAPLPGWGFAASPLVVEDLVVVATGGRLVGYDLATGIPRWTRSTGGGGYSSPHLATIDGVPQILMPNGGGLTSVAPSDGSVLWEKKGPEGTSIVQPALVGEGDILVAAGDAMGGLGIQRISVSADVARSGPAESEGWTVEERWTTRGLKPYFNDFVVHEGHAFGFDGTILSCINIEDGERKWKGGRYGAGQMVLLPEGDLLLVISEDGELVLVSATPDKHTEIARFRAIEGKTWNHPVVIGDVLLVRNGEEMAAFRLPGQVPENPRR